MNDLAKGGLTKGTGIGVGLGSIAVAGPVHGLSSAGITSGLGALGAGSMLAGLFVAGAITVGTVYAINRVVEAAGGVGDLLKTAYAE
ncbi:MAG: hypothetical protein ISR65_07255 [Bacteriovoracaceae bacterium]|nr:hypothetical protein [Bacteriovoracaceae bacterium]